MELQDLIKILIGKTKEEAVIFLKANHINYRITREDNKNYVITMDLRLDRLNLEFDKGLVTKCDIG